VEVNSAEMERGGGKHELGLSQIARMFGCLSDKKSKERR
jgi:hypothetical protein